MSNNRSPNPPPMWFRLPPGYHSLDDVTLDELEHATTAVLAPILDGTDVVERALVDAQVLVELLATVREGRSMLASIGVHPDGSDGTSLSIFTLAMITNSAPTRILAVAESALSIVESPLWRAHTRKLLELSVGPAALVAGTLAAPPPATLRQMGITVEPIDVFQARLTFSCPGSQHVAVADLTSAATRHADSYTDILEAIGHTMTFTPPHPVEAPAPRASRILELFS
ncbi:hypothetical protein [Streptomyces sp. CA-251247]|uniref:hypothetical protein n=1 Tax=Streptomyces sp. CA-251247 TaxID=3240062 RepID=UPI003D8FC766